MITVYFYFNSCFKSTGKQCKLTEKKSSSNKLVKLCVTRKDCYHNNFEHCIGKIIVIYKLYIVYN